MSACVGPRPPLSPFSSAIASSSAVTRHPTLFNCARSASNAARSSFFSAASCSSASGERAHRDPSRSSRPVPQGHRECPRPRRWRSRSRLCFSLIVHSLRGRRAVETRDGSQAVRRPCRASPAPFMAHSGQHCPDQKWSCAVALSLTEPTGPGPRCDKRDSDRPSKSRSPSNNGQLGEGLPSTRQAPLGTNVRGGIFPAEKFHLLSPFLWLSGETHVVYEGLRGVAHTKSCATRAAGGLV